MGIAETEHIGKIKERLEEPITELEALPSFIVEMAAEERFTKLQPGRWNVRFLRSTNEAPRIARPFRSYQASAQKAEPANEATRQLVCRFYQDWSGMTDHSPSSRELKQAEDLIRRYTEEIVTKTLPVVIRHMKRQFPEARAFGATLLYWPDAVKSASKSANRGTSTSSEATAIDSAPSSAADEGEQQKLRAQTIRKQQLREQWSQLSAEEQQSIRATVYGTANTFVQQRMDKHRYDDPLVELACLNELERQSNQIV